MTGRPPREPLLETLAPPLAASGFDLEDVEVTSAGRRRVVRVLIDKDGGVTLDDISEATTLVSALLDDSDALGDGSYTLEVTSRGVDRPLTQPRHWRRNADRLVTVTPHQRPLVTGRIVDADETGATIAADGSLERFEFSEIAKARVEIEFNRASPGAGGKVRRQRRAEVSGHPAGTGDDGRE